MLVTTTNVGGGRRLASAIVNTIDEGVEESAGLQHHLRMNTVSARTEAIPTARRLQSSNTTTSARVAGTATSISPGAVTSLDGILRFTMSEKTEQEYADFVGHSSVITAFKEAVANVLTLPLGEVFLSKGDITMGTRRLSHDTSGRLVNGKRRLARVGVAEFLIKTRKPDEVVRRSRKDAKGFGGVNVSFIQTTLHEKLKGSVHAGTPVNVTSLTVTLSATTTWSTSTSTSTTRSTTTLPRRISIAVTYGFNLVVPVGGRVVALSVVNILSPDHGAAGAHTQRFAQYIKANIKGADDFGMLVFVVAPHAYESITVYNTRTKQYLSPSNIGKYLPLEKPTRQKDEADKTSLIWGLSIGFGTVLCCGCTFFTCSALRIPSRLVKRVSSHGEEMNARAEQFANDCPGKVAWFIENLPAMLVQFRAWVCMEMKVCSLRVWGYFSPFFDKDYGEIK